MVEVLGPLPARPPTPPRTSRDLLDNDRAEDSPAAVQTPRDSSLHTSISTGVPSSRQSKRVNFSPWTKYIKPPMFTNSNTKLKPEVKSLPPSNECKPAKSILKATNSPVPVPSSNVENYTPESFAMLLESITQALAGDAISSRLDAYMQFFGALRAYEDLPGEKDIADKLALVTQFIQRDVTKDLDIGGPGNTNLVIQALKLSAALVWHPSISMQLPDDFKIFLVDHALNSLQEAKLPKSVLTHYMSILSTQNFNARIVTNARIVRLLTILHTLTGRVNGSAIISQRLSIYQRVLGQARSTFVSHSSLWIEHLVSGLLHHIKDIRLKAISLGFQTTISLGPNPTLSKCIRDLFDRSLDKNRKMVSEICERMSRMMSDAETGSHVPQIWSVVTLLLRTKRFSVDHWEHFKEWVLVLQKCFNCSDPTIKAQAIVGWNRFVLVVSPSETTSRSMLKMLSKPVLSQFERKKQDKNGSHPSYLALNSYYNLLYYAFRPSAAFSHIDVVWEEYIACPSLSIFGSTPSLSDRLAQILSHMLWSSQAKVWTENKVNESSKIDPEELPCVDCKWLRSRITSVLKVFENIFNSSVWVDDIEQSHIAVAWVNLSRALSYASSKEITPSPESMQAVAYVLGLLQRLWLAGPSSLNAAGDGAMDKFFERFRFLSTTMISSLGSISFTEKLLLKTADETFQAATTPTHRHPKANSTLDIPILHLLRLISDASGISEPTPSYLRLINGTLQAACNGRMSRGSRLELLRQCAEMYSNEIEFDFGIHHFARMVWASAAQLASDSLCSYPLESARERDGSVSRDYENSIKILSAGLKFTDAFQTWNQLADSLVRVVGNEKGHREIATMIVEPLAECMMNVNVRNTYLPSASLFSHSHSIPYFHEGIDSIKSTVNSAQTAYQKLLFPTHLAESVNRTLRESYDKFEPLETSGIANFIESLTSFLGSGIWVFRSAFLESLQESLALWIKDDGHKLNVASGVESRVLTACRALASAVLNILQTPPLDDTSSLQKFEGIICAGLESSHASIAKRFIDFCTSVSSSHKDLASANVSHVLQTLESRSKQFSSSTNIQLESNDSQSDMSAKSHIAYILDNVENSHSPGFRSSPVVRSEPAPASVDRPGRPQAESSHNDSMPDQLPILDGAISFEDGIGDRKQRKDVLAMIENLRSSSPAVPTPRELGFMTPPHLRNLRNAEGESETPLTPTLPPTAADSEDVFFGSSPTPSARGRTPSTRTETQLSMTTSAIDLKMDQDPPSSPPQLKDISPHREISELSQSVADTGSPTTSGNRRKKSPKRPKSRSNKKRNSTPVTNGNNSESQNQRQDVPLSSRLRSRASAGKGSENVTSQTDGSPTKMSRGSMGRYTQEEIGSPQVPTPKSNKLRAVSPSDGNDTLASQPCETAADSSWDDMDTQLASQLEQDLEGAADGVRQQKIDAPAEPSEHVPMTRKRKREVSEAATPTNRNSNKELRRSSRRASGKAPEDNDGPTQSTTSQHSTAATEGTPTPAESAPKKQRREPPGATDDKMEIEPATQEHGSSTGNTLDAGLLDASQKRRSSRLSGQAAPEIPEETPPPKRSKSPRSRNRNRRRNERRRKSASLEAAARANAAREGSSERPRSGESSQGTQGSTQESSAKLPAPQQPARESSPVKPTDTQLPAPVDTIEETQLESVQPPIERTSATPLPEPEPERPAENPSPQPQREEHPAVQTEPELPTMEAPTPAPEPAPEPREDTDMADAEPTEDAGEPNPLLPQNTPTEQSSPPPNTTTDLFTPLRRVLADMKTSSLDRPALKEMDDLLFDIRVEMHEAARRHSHTSTSTSTNKNNNQGS
ncbi:Rap1-interacting factor 1 N terminal-domain-containing protein [Aspergillus taichungensis]|uniref:Rap1-interacting factor 1 N terminal-domain-containing protein n=1 Tax=Aspergillus taichungensis TaxID=482145 RepID=A0A2J5HYU3_9EURO|nr:Rap1-interacting factor 1 N terminal-domain-containing protein [Aspergillus taichungensis]